MKYVDVYTYKGERVITAATLAAIIKKDRRTITCKVKANASIFGSGEVALLGGETFRAFLRENNVYGNVLGTDACRVFNQAGAEKVLGLFCKSGVTINFNSGEVVSTRPEETRDAQGITIESNEELKTAMERLLTELRAFYDTSGKFERTVQAHQTRSIARTILDYVDAETTIPGNTRAK